MNNRQKRLVGVEAVLAGAAGALAVVSVFWRDWIEILFRWDPDHHSGSAELVAIIGLATLGLVLGLTARWQALRWRGAAATGRS